MAVIAEESRPPDSSVHLGTSATSWRRTMSSSSSRTWAIEVALSSVCSRVASVQYRVVRRPWAVTVTTVPGSTSRMPSQTAWPGVLTNANSSRRPSRVTVCSASGLARMALGSEPNSTPSEVS
jgi:hypothetical protein